ncbi:DUF747-domain-containing protein [Basidiobolus meristosporus CBS 931.73]|uniref:DUF747-domain-containing protein n=1 Tax=Basidiobolus meristosporus CBS 931.73 TaxID=1314790 RepID=A0A1Y1YK80_9FUNG|nr:DUF747-domain-containing protein [Basidiobolus meristosporus CBS 931.73]|eukprot:ORX98156.1 DUF747-domain-containing protein [Basidiobolus meristosporus CBS 931.73]
MTICEDKISMPKTKQPELQENDEQIVPNDERLQRNQSAIINLTPERHSNNSPQAHDSDKNTNNSSLKTDILPPYDEDNMHRTTEFPENLTIQPLESQLDLDVSPSSGIEPAITSGTLRKRSSSILQRNLEPAVDKIAKESTLAKENQNAEKVEEAEIPEFTFSIWTYLRSELTAGDFDQSHEIKSERILNFLHIPWEFEKLVTFGYFICLDSLLHTFCILPGRILIALWGLFCRITGKSSRMKQAQKSDLYKGALIVICSYMLTYIEPSRLYHIIRGQSFVKLYFIFNCLEIFDKLCSSFGLDVLDSLFSRDVLSSGNEKKGVEHLRLFTHFFLGLVYTFVHSMVFFYQALTLNVAVNSYNNALLSLLVSNQFGEIKSNVFKRFEKENLFQLSCSDVVERFQLSIFLMIITIRNIIELSGSSSTLLPTFFFPLFPNTGSLFDSVITPVLVVFFTEYLVDWLKHAFISKFNRIRPTVYARYVDVLARDLVAAKETSQNAKENPANTLVDRTTTVSRRIGFANLPICCLIIRMFLHSLGSFGFWDNLKNGGGVRLETLFNLNSGGDILRFFGDLLNLHPWSEQFIYYGMWTLIVLLIYACLIAIKLIIGINLISFSLHRHTGMLEREQAAQTIAKDQYETELDDKLKQTLNDPELIVPLPNKLTLDTIDRYTLFKSRIP